MAQPCTAYATVLCPFCHNRIRFRDLINQQAARNRAFTAQVQTTKPLDVVFDPDFSCSPPRLNLPSFCCNFPCSLSLCVRRYSSTTNEGVNMSTIFQGCTKERENGIVIVGLDAAGKTTWLYRKLWPSALLFAVTNHT